MVNENKKSIYGKYRKNVFNVLVLNLIIVVFVYGWYKFLILNIVG